MIDPHVLTETPDVVKASLRRRHAPEETFASVDRAVTLSELRRALATERDELRARRNAVSSEIGGMMKAGRREDAEALKAEVAAGKVRIEVIEAELARVEDEVAALTLVLPNLLHPSVPDGADAEANVEVRRWGTPRQGGEPHVEIGERLGMLDFERAAKLSGARFSVQRGPLARLERALVNFFLDLHTEEHGYTEVVVPYMVHRHCMVGTGQLPKFEADMFRLADRVNGEDAFLVPTAEVPVTNLHREEILDESMLPLKYVAFTPCFRAEAGAAGRDVRGLIRQHQFHKVELVWITAPEASEAAHEALVSHAEVCLKRLELPYRTVALCGGDISANAWKCYDLEVWLPSQGTYREISSVSNFGDYQARRMQTRYRPTATDAKKAKVRVPHTLNGSGLAVGRTLVAILENFHQEDGSVWLPPALRPYMGGKERIERGP